VRLRGSRRALACTVLGVALAAGCGTAPAPLEPATGVTDPGTSALLGPVDRAAGSPVGIGLFNVEGGPVSLPAVGDAAVAAADYANEHLGGLGGHPLQVVRCADKGDGASAAACADLFVRERVAAVVAGQPASADQIVPVVLKAGIPWVGSSPSAASEIGSSEPFFFGSGFVGTLAAWAQYSEDLGYRTVTLYGADNPQLVASVQAVGKPLFDKVGVALKVVTVAPGGPEATLEVAEGLQSRPDAVIVVADTSVCQSILAALHTAGATQPKLVNSACVGQSVIAAVGESVIDNAVVFTIGDPSGNTQESQLYRAVMAQYAPSVDPTGITPTGYLSMLGFVRAVNAGGLAGEVTPDAVRAAIRAARDVPRPIGDSGTFSCDRSAIPTALVKATICTSELLYTTYSGGVPGRYGKIDIAPLFQ
jgi:branched-chain amino acid transport system substrate-binding protein